jgi:hypothetical protein
MPKIGHIELVCGLGRTPKTHYSGNRVIGKINIITPENVMVVTREFSGNSNAEAEALALQECHMVLPAKGATALGIQFFKSFVHEHEGLGKISSWKKIQEDILNNAGISFREAGIAEYLTVLQGTEIYSENSAVMFHGWKKPVNLIEQGWQLGFLETVAGFPCSIQFAFCSNANVDVSAIAETSVITHLEKMGYNFSSEESEEKATRRRSGAGGQGRSRTPKV